MSTHGHVVSTFTLIEKIIDLTLTHSKHHVSKLSYFPIQRDLQPFWSLIMASTICAMTHIAEDIRLDSLKFLDLWMTHGREMVQKHAEEVSFVLI